MAQCLVPSWIKTNMWQITWIFLPSYSSSIWLSIFTFSKYCNCFRQILYDYFQDCHHITCTNAFEGQAWKQACLCLSLDYLLWSTIKPVNNILVKSWNTLIDWLIDWAWCWCLCQLKIVIFYFPCLASVVEMKNKGVWFLDVVLFH